MTPPVLYQLRFSHFNEKGRWALDYKAIPHLRKTLAPGFHPRRSRRLGGNGTTPLLQVDGQAIADSTAIVAWAEEEHPDPPLYPADPTDRARALDLEDHFDEELGPYSRGAVFDAILPHDDVVVPATSQGLGAAGRLTMRLTVPVARRSLRRVLIDDPGGPERCRAKTAAGFDRVEEELGDGDYLVGGAFSVADLTAAALLSPIVCPPEFPYQWPDRWPDEYEEFRRSLADRHSYEWVGEMFRRHRGRSAEVGNG